jgi:hypothetical protein
MTSEQSVTNLILVEGLFLIRHFGRLGVMKFSAVSELPSFVSSVVCVLSHGVES